MSEVRETDLGAEVTPREGIYKFLVLPFQEDGTLGTSISDSLANNQSDAVMVADDHRDSRIRLVLTEEEARRLSRLGVTDYLIEGSPERQNDLDDLYSGRSSKLPKKSALGPYSNIDPSFINAIINMMSAGIQ